MIPIVLSPFSKQTLKSLLKILDKRLKLVILSNSSGSDRLYAWKVTHNNRVIVSLDVAKAIDSIKCNVLAHFLDLALVPHLYNESVCSILPLYSRVTVNGWVSALFPLVRGVSCCPSYLP